MSDARLRVLQLAALALFALPALQLAHVQLFSGGRYEQALVARQLRTFTLAPARGVIVDRNGVVVARNQPRFSVQLVPGELSSDAAARRDALLRVERFAGTPYATIERAVSAGERSVDPFVAVTVVDGVSLERAIALRAAFAGLAGVHVEAAPARVYEHGELLAHVLGYTGPIAEQDAAEYARADYPLNAIVGQAGVELVYERALRGVAGTRLIAADLSAAALARARSVAPQPGAELVLALDVRLQEAATAALRDGIAAGLPRDGRDASGGVAAAAGAALVMDVRNGDLLALASLPGYDVNTLAVAEPLGVERLLSDPARPLLHRAYMEVHAPGSIFKPVVGAAALQEGVATARTLITSNGAITVQDRYRPGVQYVFRDWAAHGTLDFAGGLARSSDVYFYLLAGGYDEAGHATFAGLGEERLARYTRAFGFGERTGLDLPGEAAGLVPDDAWKQRTFGQAWVLGDTYTFGIGQGYFTATPLQMAVAIAAIANGGERVTPRVARALREGGVERARPATSRGRVPVAEEHLATVRAGMLAAASAGGTATEGKPGQLTIGGKTGTAEFGTRRPDGSYDAHAWYVAFAPYERPEVAVVVYLEHGTGAIHAAPVARRILEAWAARAVAPAVAASAR
ncbi:MAG: penicillin-binding protein 2 [Dehalococcoidia bacterium]|nr:penicillin-binding protein 2 [Dehalococcoidia bacterium]